MSKKSQKTSKLKLLPKKTWVLVGGILVIGAIGGLLFATNRNPGSLAASIPYSCPSKPTLRRGSLGDCVRKVQYELNVIHFFSPDKRMHLAKTDKPLAVDGDFGLATEYRVKQFQLKYNAIGNRIAVDGIVGPDTWFGISLECGFVIIDGSCY